MAKPQSIRGITLTINGLGYAGELMEFTPPEMVEKMEAYRGGNMAGEVDVVVGIEKMEASFKLSKHDVNINVVQSVIGNHAVFIFRAAMDEFGKQSAITWLVDGRLMSSKYGTITPGKLVENEHGVSVYRYVKLIDGLPVEACNMESGEVAYNGIDVLESFRDLIDI